MQLVSNRAGMRALIARSLLPACLLECFTASDGKLRPQTGALCFLGSFHFETLLLGQFAFIITFILLRPYVSRNARMTKTAFAPKSMIDHVSCPSKVLSSRLYTN